MDWQKSYVFKVLFCFYSTLRLSAVMRIVLIFIVFPDVQYQCVRWLHCPFCSNPVVQVKAMEEGALQTLLTTLATSQLLSVKKKVHVNRLQHSSTLRPHTCSLMGQCSSCRSCLLWPLFYATSPLHSSTSCPTEGCRFYQSCSRQTEEFCAHASSPCCMIWSVKRFSTLYIYN